MHLKRITSFQQLWQKTGDKLSICTSLIAIHICIRIGTFRKMLIQIHTNLLKNQFPPKYCTHLIDIIHVQKSRKVKFLYLKLYVHVGTRDNKYLMGLHGGHLLIIL